MTPELRERIGRIAVDAARAAGYRSAGTIEGLLSPEGDYFFMEMNTRIQVEHTVTELVTGLDLVREQVLVAAGEPLSLRQEDVVLRGHAIECRINAEDPSQRLPARARGGSRATGSRPGRACASTPASAAGSEISGLYDPMIAKLIVHDTDRESARRRMLRALGEFEIGGVKSLLGFHQALLGHPCFIAGETCYGLVESELLAEQASSSLSRQRERTPRRGRSADRAGNRRRNRRASCRREAARRRTGLPRAGAPKARARAASGAFGAGSGIVASPMQGTVLDVKVAVGDRVAAGEVVCIVEAMKMENEVAHRGRGRSPRWRSRPVLR